MCESASMKPPENFNQQKTASNSFITMSAETLIPILICVVLPIAIVLIRALTKINADNKRSEIIMKALEANKEVDTDKLIDSLKAPGKSTREILNTRLLCGCRYSLVGTFLIFAGFLANAISESGEPEVAMILLLIGGVSLAMGASYLIVYYVTRKQADSYNSK